MAWEVYKAEHLINYVLSWQYIGTRFTADSNSPDYMAVMDVVMNVIRDLLLPVPSDNE